MASCCPIVCLMLGLAGLILFCVGFALPYWFVDPDAGGASHGLWEKKECLASGCTDTRIPFGVTAAFEACRVFSCATVVMAIVSFIFNLLLVNRPTKVWGVRTTSVWTCTVFFNLLVVVIFGVTEKETLEALALSGVDTSSGIETRLEWGYWAAIGALVIFVLLALSCAVMSCYSEMSNKKEAQPEGNRHLTNINLYHTGGDSYPVDNVSVVTTKTADVFPPSATQTVVQPAVHSAVLQTAQQPAAQFGAGLNNGYVSQPTRAAFNIDHQKVRLNALDAPHHVSAVKQMEERARQDKDRFVLNRPVYSPRVANRDNCGTELPFQQLSAAGQNGVYSINISQRGFPLPATAASQSGLQAHNRPLNAREEPPAYTTLPRDDRQPVTIIPVSSSSGYVSVNTGNRLYPSLQ